MFLQKEPDQEYQMLFKDDVSFSETRSYLLPLIEKAVDSSGNKEKLKKLLLEDVSLAAKRFLENPENIKKNIKFSSYFTWYIHKRLSKENSLKKILRTIFR